MRKYLSAAAALVLSAGVAQAGGTATPAEPVVIAPAPAPVAYDWTGAYAGLGLTYGRTNHRTATAPNFWPNGSGAGLGAFLGYNWQSGNMVYGVEGHIAGQRTRGTTTTAVGEVRTDLGTLASIRGRVGVANDRTLFFLTAGPAFGRVNHNAVTAGLSETRSVYGAMVGIGIEQAMRGGWHLRGDLEHYRFRSTDFTTAGPGSFPGVRTSANVARISAVWRF